MKNFINTPTDPANPYRSALDLFKQRICNSMADNDKRYGEKSLEHYRMKHVLVQYAFDKNPDIVEAAFKYEQKKICGFLGDKDFGLNSEIYIHPDIKDKSWMSNHAMKAIHSETRRLLDVAFASYVIEDKTGVHVSKAFMPEISCNPALRLK